MQGLSEACLLKDRLCGVLFEKLEGFNLPVSEDNKIFNNLTILDFESFCVHTEEKKKHKLQLGSENLFQFQSQNHQKPFFLQ